MHFKANNLNFSVTTCDKPTIVNGTVSPSDATVDYEATYEVTCASGYTISGTSTMTCGTDGTFDQTPICEGIALLISRASYI